MDNVEKYLDRDVVKGILYALQNGEETITYGDLSKIIEGFCGRKINAHTQLPPSLGRIQKYCSECGVPCLSAVVVNQTNNTPGTGFIGAYKQTHPEDSRTDEVILEAEQEACRNNPRWEPLLEHLGLSLDDLWDEIEDQLDTDALNWSALVPMLDQYEDELESHRPEEIYKWQAAEHFQQHWDLDALDFAEMLSQSLEKTGNLLTSGMYFARGMIVGIVKNNPEAARESFRRLFDESVPLDERMKRFSSDMDGLLAELNIVRDQDGQHPAINHYQDPHAMSVYLALAKDSTHYIYKAEPFRTFAARIGADSPGGKYDKVNAFEKLCDQLLNYLLTRRRSMVAKSDLLLGDQLSQADSGHRMLAQDIVFYASWSIARNWAYAPGEQAKHWADLHDAGIMGIGWEALGDPARFKTKKELKEALSDVYHVDNPQNDADTIWAFVKEVKPGDIIWARRGMHQVIGRGVVTSEYRYDSSRAFYHGVRDVDWSDDVYLDVPDSGNFMQRTLYELTEKTAVKASGLQAAFDEYGKSDNVQIAEPEENAPELMSAQSKNYWWLNASPKIWSFSDVEPGDEITYTIYADSGNPRRVHANFLAAKEGDVVIGYEATPVKKVVALCEITRNTDDTYLYFKKIKDLVNPVPYTLIKDDDVLGQSQFAKNPNGSLFSLTEEEFDRIMELVGDDAPVIPSSKAEPYTDEQFLEKVYVSPEDLATMKRLLDRKKNLILQGAPGTGKTYCARHLAWAFMGERDEGRVHVVQFHQNTTYDDMMAGYRPSDESGFEVVPGEFLRFCDKAAQDPDKRPWVFIIDEINRANISKVFGELLMLIESSHRDESVKHPLLGRNVRVPGNLYLIGMMNTADRGLALIDYALRRRFAFFEMDPAFGNGQFESYVVGTGNAKLAQLAKRVEKLNTEIEQDPSFGPGFRIGHSYFCFDKTVTDNDVADVVEYELAPLIREYWFDAPDTAEAKISELRSVL